MRISDLSITSNGKLYRKALPEPSLDDMIEEEYVAPEAEIEKIIYQIYSEVLKIPVNSIGKTSDFYQLGGDSLNAVSLSSAIEKYLI